MITLLRVRNFAIIDELEVELAPGLNVVTGETGAGKSILVAALQLVLGGKGRPEVVRAGADQAEVEVLVDLGGDAALRERLGDAGLTAADELVIRRVIGAKGRTRAYVNGRLATQAQLRTLAAGLADISSQHEYHSLADARSHLGYLDAFGGLGEERTAVAEAHRALASASAALRALEVEARERADREDLLRFQLAEIDDLAPEPGEMEALEAERARLRHAEQLADAAGGAEEALYARDGSLSESLAKVVAKVREGAALDAALGPMAGQLGEALSVLEDVAADLGRYARDVRVDPERLGEVEDRLVRLGRLVRKHGGAHPTDLEAVLARRAEAQGELDALERHDERLAEARATRDAALAEATSRARVLSERRHAIAATLGGAISEELEGLGMGGARVLVELAPLEEGSEADPSVDGARLSATGIDRAEFLIAPNRGEPARALRKIASGGELSRAMLAIKRVLAGLGPAGLYVFDEVDAGVGGAVAEVIGKKLVDVAAHAQVLCITHLAQIAVHGDAHFRVSKHAEEERTYSEVCRLDEGERLEEVARMVGGLKITRKTRAAAAEMLSEARRAGSGDGRGERAAGIG
ncbi:MAG: DNA repair protein RecN [Myxococcota bacterium]